MNTDHLTFSGHYFRNCLLSLFILAGMISSSRAQKDTLKISLPAKQDSLQKISDNKPRVIPVSTPLPTPGKVAKASMLFPGYGQVINHKVWKVPVLYAAAAGLAYIVIENQKQYHRFDVAYTGSNNNLPVNDPALRAYTTQQLWDKGSQAKVQRNQAVAGLTLLYLGNIFDAYRDAHYRSTGHSLLYFSQPHSPKKAAAYSAMLPGLGQGYNHKYWKIPLIYASGAGLAWFFWYEQGNFDFYTRAYHSKLDPKNSANQTDPLVINRSAAYLLEEKNYFNRYRDLAIIGTAAWYILNVVDAAVDAHFWNFDKNIDDNLSIRVSPVMMPVYGSIIPAAGLRAVLPLH